MAVAPRMSDRDWRQHRRRWRAMLADPSASPEALTSAAETLRFLADDSYYDYPGEDIVEGIAAHPNTPPDSLLVLWKSFPDQTCAGLCRNPILPLLPLEKPDFVGGLPKGDALSLLRRRGLTAPMARLLTTHPDRFVAWEARTAVVVSGEFAPDADWYAELERDFRTLANFATGRIVMPGDRDGSDFPAKAIVEMCRRTEFSPAAKCAAVRSLSPWRPFGAFLLLRLRRDNNRYVRAAVRSRIP